MGFEWMVLGVWEPHVACRACRHAPYPFPMDLLVANGWWRPWAGCFL